MHCLFNRALGLFCLAYSRLNVFVFDVRFSVARGNVSQSFEQSFTSSSSSENLGNAGASASSSSSSVRMNSLPNGNTSAPGASTLLGGGEMPPYVEERVEPVNGIVQPPVDPPANKPRRNTTQLQYILKVLNRHLWKHNYAWPFQSPVNALQLALPDYHKIITRPMDMGTIKKRLENCWYNSVQECVEDFNLMFNNCYTYNKEGEDVVLMARTLHNLLKEKLSQMPKEDIELPLPLKGHKGKTKNKNKGLKANKSKFGFW